MKLSYSWLRQFVPLKADAQTVGEKLTLHTAELEETIERSHFFKDVFLGKLEKVSQHPESEKLHIGSFDLGGKEKKQIVFGSVHVLNLGEIVPLALDGATLASGINITNTEVRSQKSEGMVCDNQELGLSMEGLMKFQDESLIGKSLIEVSEAFSDTLFDIDNKSLTHRPDLMGHRGFARELSAIFKTNLVLPEPVVSLPRNAKPFPVSIKADGCRRFCALQLENITVKEAPIDVRIMLENLGVRSLNNFVDITNWIMLEFGQPMHVFDADKIQGDIVVRFATEGERLTVLDGKEYELTTDDMVVADDSGAISIAGVMGGLSTSVTADTKNILFEVASWDPVRVRKTSQRLGIRTESSSRYEKSLDPEWCRKAILAATEKALEFCPEANVATDLTDVYPVVFPKVEIQLDPDLVRRFAGTDIKDTQINAILTSLGFNVKKSGKGFKVEIPTFRATKDISLPEDLVEEVIRIYGFEALPSNLPTLPMIPPAKNILRNLEWEARDFFAHGGYLEVYNHSFFRVSNADLPDQYIQVENPLSDEYQFLRKNLILNMVRDIESELRTHNDLQFFELGKTYIPQEREVLPEERLKFLAFRAKMGGKEDSMFFDLKQDLEQFFAQLGVDCDFDTNTDPLEYEHPSKSAKIFVGGKFLGNLSVMHPQAVSAKNAVVVFAEFDFENLCEVVTNREETYRKISPYPPVYRDLSIVLSEDVTFGAVKKLILNESQLIQKVVLFDEYQDANKLGVGVKNLAFHLEFRSWDETLKDEAVDQEFEVLLSKLKSELGAVLRLDFDQQQKV